MPGKVVPLHVVEELVDPHVASAGQQLAKERRDVGGSSGHAIDTSDHCWITGYEHTFDRRGEV